MTSCGTDKTDPTKAWEKHDNAKAKREQLEKDVADQQEEIREDNEELETLQQKLEAAREKEKDLLKEAQSEASHYSN
jgi:chromosome segregation ATPase